MSDDWRDDPAFLRDEAIRQAALATGAMRDNERLREALDWIYTEPEDALKVQCGRERRSTANRSGGSRWS
jgi:hypothetical protein